MSEIKLRQTLARELRLQDPRFRLERIGHRLMGSVISASFKGKSDSRRQQMIWRALTAALGATSEREVGTLLAYTPEEWDVDLPHGRAPRADRIRKPSRRKVKQDTR